MDKPKYSRPEHERRFLVNVADCPTLPSQYVQINDRYLDQTRLRLRMMVPSNGDPTTYKLCKKYGGSALVSEPIVNIYLDQSEYEMLTVLPGHQVSKRRYHLYWQGSRFGVDIFAGALAGLVLCEVEAPTLVELAAITAPPWVRTEVTHDSRFTGGNLCRLNPVACAALVAQSEPI